MTGAEVGVLVFRCGCCLGTFVVMGLDKPPRDEDLGVVVCPECKRNLQWAHAWLRREGIAPCTERKDTR